MGDDELAYVILTLQIGVIAHGSSIRFAGFLKVLITRVRMRVEGGNDLPITNSTPPVRRENDTILGTLRPPNNGQIPRLTAQNKATLLMPARSTRV